jgi:hypothetical protein
MTCVRGVRRALARKELLIRLHRRLRALHAAASRAASCRRG